MQMGIVANSQDRFALVYRSLKDKAAGVQLGAAVLCTDDQLEGCSIRLGASAAISTNGKILTYLQVCPQPALTLIFRLPLAQGYSGY